MSQRTPEQAIAAVNHQSTHGPRFGYGLCQMKCHEFYGVPSDGTPDATQGWYRSKHKHPTTNAESIPRGALPYWLGGSHRHGHVAISAGEGMCWSTDIRRTGYFDKVPIAEIHARWGLTLVGWTEDIDGVRVYVPPGYRPATPHEPPPKEENSMANFTEADLRRIVREETDKSVRKYMAETVDHPTPDNPKNTIWVSTALGMILRKVSK